MASRQKQVSRLPEHYTPIQAKGDTHFRPLTIRPFFFKLHRHTKKSGPSQNTEYHVLIIYNPLSVWCHQPLMLRHRYHKRGKLRITGFMNQWIVDGIRTQLSHILMYFDSLNKNTLSIRSFYPLILCKLLQVIQIAEKCRNLWKTDIMNIISSIPKPFKIKLLNLKPLNPEPLNPEPLKP